MRVFNGKLAKRIKQDTATVDGFTRRLCSTGHREPFTSEDWARETKFYFDRIAADVKTLSDNGYDRNGKLIVNK